MSYEPSKPLKAVIDTDIGTDIDDAYALLFALSSSELDVKGVTLVHGDMHVRKKLTFKLLKLLGREDVPVAEGQSLPMNPDRPIIWGGHEGRGIDFSDVEDMKPARKTAVEYIKRMAEENPGEIVLITIGPMTNAGLLIRDYPESAGKLRTIVSMASTFNGFGPENASGEHNISLDPESVAIVLNSGIPTLLIGLNVTMKTALTSEHSERIRSFNTPLAEVIGIMTEDWLKIRNSSWTAMHDALAVAVAFRPDIVETVPVRAEVNLDNAGFITYYEAGEDSPIRICTSVDADRFHEVFHSRILKACEE